MTATDDGDLFPLDEQGRSVRPPLHVPEITCVVPVPGVTLPVVGARAGAHGVDLPNGAHLPLIGFDEGAAVTCAAEVAGHVLVGPSDATVREVLLEGGTALIAELETPGSSSRCFPKGRDRRRRRGSRSRGDAAPSALAAASPGP